MCFGKKAGLACPAFFCYFICLTAFQIKNHPHRWLYSKNMIRDARLVIQHLSYQFGSFLQ